MSDDQNMIRHPLHFENHLSQAIDDVKVAFASRSRISVMQFIFAPKLELFWELVSDLLVCHALHPSRTKFVQHSHLLNIKLFIVEELSRLHTSFKHASPDTEIPVSRCLTGVRWVWWRRISRSWGKVSGRLFLNLMLLPRIT